MLDAELDLREERRKEKDARELRDGTRTKLRDLLVAARSILEGAMKRGAGAALGGLDPNLVQEAIDSDVSRTPWLQDLFRSGN